MAGKVLVNLTTGMEDAEKVTLVLTRLLSQWLSDVESMAPGDTTYLPYEFDDQCSGWLQVTAAEDGNLDVLPVWSVLEGWAFIPSAYASGQQAVGRTEPVWANLQPQRMSREEALACISAAIAVAEGQTRT